MISNDNIANVDMNTISLVSRVFFHIYRVPKLQLYIAFKLVKTSQPMNARHDKPVVVMAMSRKALQD